jgi:mRNA interferase RelE/StbE
MASYKIEIKKSAQKEIQKLPDLDMKRIVKKIESLATNPRGPDSKKLSSEERYRVRVGQYRILYEIYDDVLVVMVVKIAHRKDVYR